MGAEQGAVPSDEGTHPSSPICAMSLRLFVAALNKLSLDLQPGLHKLWYPGIRDRSTWSKFGAHEEHGDVFLFSNLGAL